MSELARLIVAAATVAVFTATSLVAIANDETGTATAAPSQYLSVDVTTDGNARNAVGVIDSCTSVQSGEAFFVDVVVMDVADIVAWEFRFEFDHEVVALNAVDYDHFLLSNDEGITISPKLLDIENPNRVFIGAGEARGAPDSGSGVLARLSMEATGEGVSPLKITSQPAFRAPRVTNSAGDFVGDSNGDGLWDSGITAAQVAVDASCEDLPPIATPPPTPPQSPGGGGGSGGGSGSSSGSASGGAGVAVVDGDPPGDGEDGAGADSDAFTEDTDDGSDGPGGGGEGTLEDEQGEEDPGDAEARNASGSGNDDGDGSLPLVVGGIALGAVAIGAGTLFVFRRRDTW